MSVEGYLERWVSKVSEKISNFQDSVKEKIGEIHTMKQQLIVSGGEASQELQLEKGIDKLLDDLRAFKEDDADLQVFLENSFQNNFDNLKHLLKLEVLTFKSKISFLQSEGCDKPAGLNKKYLKFSEKIYLELLEKRKTIMNRQEITNNINMAKILYGAEEIERNLNFKESSHQSNINNALANFDIINKLLQSGQFKLVRIDPKQQQNQQQQQQQQQLQQHQLQQHQLQQHQLQQHHQQLQQLQLQQSSNNNKIRKDDELNSTKENDSVSSIKKIKYVPYNQETKSKNEISVSTPHNVPTTTKVSKKNLPTINDIKNKLKLRLDSNTTQTTSPPNSNGAQQENANVPHGNDDTSVANQDTNVKLETENNTKKRKRSKPKRVVDPISQLEGDGYFSIDFGETYSSRRSRTGAKQVSYKE